MKSQFRLKTLPPKIDYTSKSEADRKQIIFLAMSQIKAEFHLYKRTCNGAHMWRCFQLWRQLMPEDLALPRELLEYFDRCADGIASETEPDAIKNAMDLTKSPGDMAEHGGGPSGKSAAEPTRKQRDAMQYISNELFGALIRSHPKKPQRGHKTTIYENAAAKFGYSISHIRRLLRDWLVAETVQRDYGRWINQQK